jgi:hypothetical protein
MATVAVESLYDSDRLDRLYKLFRRYEARTWKGVENGHLFFNADQIIKHAGKMARWHLKMEEQERQNKK